MKKAQAEKANNKNAVGKERTEGKRSTPIIRQKEKTSNRNYSLLAGDVRRLMVLVAATSPSYSASTTTVDRRAYFAELQVQLSSCHSYKAALQVHIESTVVVGCFADTRHISNTAGLYHKRHPTYLCTIQVRADGN